MSRISSTFKKSQDVSESPKSAFLSSIPRTRSPSPVRRSRSPSQLRASSGSLNKSLSNSIELKSIESDYIKNLQQQVYFLELEANYLREQAKKATDMHPRMTAEAERMLKKLRELQLDVDDLNLEVKRKDQRLDVVQSEKEKVLTKLEIEEIERQREKRILAEEIVELRKERDRLSLENSRKSNQIDFVSTDKEKLQLELMNADDTIRILRKSLDDKTDQFKMLQLELEEKKTQLFVSEKHARELEDRYIKNSSILYDRTVTDLRDEIRQLQKKSNEAEIQANEDRRMRTQTETDSADILRENNYLFQKVKDLEKQLAREKELRDSTDEKRSRNLAELSLLTEKEKDLTLELRRMQEALRDEKSRADRYLQQLGKQEEMSSSLEASNSTNRGKVYELEGKVKFLDNENKQLRRDKELLVDHVAELQRQVSLRSSELSSSKLRIKGLETDINTYETVRELDDSMQSQKWKEFESLADSMKTISRSMARSTSPPQSPVARRSSRKMKY